MNVHTRQWIYFVPRLSFRFVIFFVKERGEKSREVKEREAGNEDDDEGSQ